MEIVINCKAFNFVNRRKYYITALIQLLQVLSAKWKKFSEMQFFLWRGMMKSLGAKFIFFKIDSEFKNSTSKMEHKQSYKIFAYTQNWRSYILSRISVACTGITHAATHTSNKILFRQNFDTIRYSSLGMSYNYGDITVKKMTPSFLQDYEALLFLKSFVMLVRLKSKYRKLFQ